MGMSVKSASRVFHSDRVCRSFVQILTDSRLQLNFLKQVNTHCGILSPPYILYVEKSMLNYKQHQGYVKLVGDKNSRVNLK